MEHTTRDGYTLRVFSSMYVDWGLEITKSRPDGETVTVYYNPSALNRESYGYTWEDEDGEPLEEGIPWTPDQWRACLEADADDLLEAFAWEDTEET